MVDGPDGQHSEATRIHYVTPDDLDGLPVEVEEQSPIDRSAASVAGKLEGARQALRSGDRQRAFQLSTEATHVAPEHTQAWLYRAALADTEEDRLIYLSKVVSLAPGNLQARRAMYQALLRYLEEDPFLRYLEETDLLYRVVTGEGRVVSVSKERAIYAHYPPVGPTLLEPAHRWLLYSLLGVLLAGVGAVVCAPVAALYAWRASHQESGPGRRNQAQRVLAYAVALWVIGLTISTLFLLHL